MNDFIELLEDALTICFMFAALALL